MISAGDPVAIASARGHTVAADPPHDLSAAERWTCENCGCAVIRYGLNVYGSATTEDCNHARP